MLARRIRAEVAARSSVELLLLLILTRPIQLSLLQLTAQCREADRDGTQSQHPDRLSLRQEGR
jgi:hypothetical protein